MHHVIEGPRPKCSHCGNINRVETFQQLNREGIRCLVCGHEKTTWDRAEQEQRFRRAASNFYHYLKNQETQEF